MSGTLQPSPVTYPQRRSHTGRNLAITLVFLVIVLAGFFAPVFTVTDISPSFFGSSFNLQVKGSLSYMIFKCGEVYYSYSGSVYGQQFASVNGYRWVCGQ